MESSKPNRIASKSLTGMGRREGVGVRIAFEFPVDDDWFAVLVEEYGGDGRSLQKSGSNLLSLESTEDDVIEDYKRFKDAVRRANQRFATEVGPTRDAEAAADKEAQGLRRMKLQEIEAQLDQL
jgi:hypothetical protein